MNPKEPTDFVIEAFGRGLSRDEIIQKMRAKFDMNPREAEMFVVRVETDHEQDIAIRQGPVLFGMSLFAFLLGIVLILGSIWNLAAPLLATLSNPPVPLNTDALFGPGMQFLIGLSLAISGLRWLRGSMIMARILHRKS